MYIHKTFRKVCNLKRLLLFLFRFGQWYDCNLDRDEELQGIYASDLTELNAFQTSTVGSTNVLRQAITRRKIKNAYVGKENEAKVSRARISFISSPSLPFPSLPSSPLQT